LLSLVLWAVLAIFATKTALVFTQFANPDLPPRLNDGRPLAALARAAACCAEDAAAGLGFLLLGGLALRCFCARLALAFFHLLAAGALLLLAIDVHVFAELRCFLKASHLESLGGVRFERSVTDAATPAVRLTLVALPLLTLALHLAVVRAWPRLFLAGARMLFRPALALVLVVVLLLGARAAERKLFRDGNGDFARNPHLVLLRSFVQPGLPGPDDLPFDPSDFLPGRPQPGAKLAGKRPTNIVLIVIESLAAPYLDLTGGPLSVTPNLCRLRGRGLVFDRFYATTNLSVASALPLFGSTYNDVRDWATVVVHRDFPVPSAAAWLKKQGYHTYFVGAGGRRSWETSQTMVDAFVRGPFDLDRDPRHPFWRRHADPGCFLDDNYLDHEAFADARRALREAAGQKFFLMIWNYATHVPYWPRGGPEAFPEKHFPPVARSDPDKKASFQAYLRSLWCVDALIGELYAELEHLGLASDTLVVVTGDHGESWGQHGHFLHSTSLYEEEIHVPLVMVHPTLAPLGPRSLTLGSHIDLWPTIMDVCGLPCDSRWQGRSLLGGRSNEERRAYFYMKRTWVGLREGKYKYLWDASNQRKRLFDLEADPGERRNLAPRQPQLCACLHRRVLDWIQFQAALTRQRLAEARGQ
jgi:arylsulfatase A-like enzyme